MKKPKMPLETVRPVSRVRPFPPRRDYASLSIKDLLDARDAYHVYLSTLDNVVATAVASRQRPPPGSLDRRLGKRQRRQDRRLKDQRVRRVGTGTDQPPRKSVPAEPEPRTDGGVRVF